MAGQSPGQDVSTFTLTLATAGQRPAPCHVHLRPHPPYEWPKAIREGDSTRWTSPGLTHLRTQRHLGPAGLPRQRPMGPSFQCLLTGEMGRQRPREGQCCAQGHTARNRNQAPDFQARAVLPSADIKRREGARRVLGQLRTQLLPREMSRAGSSSLSPLSLLQLPRVTIKPLHPLNRQTPCRHCQV